jgi:hypothetical protein
MCLFYIYGAFQCVTNIFNVFEYISVYSNVFTNIVIGNSPLHSNYNTVTMRTHMYICFPLSTMTPFPTYFTTTLFFSFTLIFSNFHTIYVKITYQIFNFHFKTSPHILHSIINILNLHSKLSLFAQSIVEPKFSIKATKTI